MPATISLYNHTARLFADGTNAIASTYKVRLLTAATFDASHATLAATGGTEVASANGYTTGGATLSGASVSTVTTNDAVFDASDVSWSASGGAITASYAILYNLTATGSPPLAFIDFGGSTSAASGSDFQIVWGSGGIFTFTVS